MSLLALHALLQAGVLVIAPAAPTVGDTITVARAMEVPAEPLWQMGAKHVISVAIPSQDGLEDYGNMFSVVSRCFQVMSSRTENSWRRYSNVVIVPPVARMAWDSFDSAKRLIDLGEEAAMAVMPTILKWLPAATSAESEKKTAPGRLSSAEVPPALG